MEVSTRRKCLRAISVLVVLRRPSCVGSIAAAPDETPLLATDASENGEVASSTDCLEIGATASQSALAGRVLGQRRSLSHAAATPLHAAAAPSHAAAISTPCR